METFGAISCAKQDDEELAWLADAKKGQGFQRSEERRESAETAYHRLLFQESVEQVRRFGSRILVYTRMCLVFVP